MLDISHKIGQSRIILKALGFEELTELQKVCQDQEGPHRLWLTTLFGEATIVSLDSHQLQRRLWVCTNTSDCAYYNGLNQLECRP